MKRLRKKLVFLLFQFAGLEVMQVYLESIAIVSLKNYTRYRYKYLKLFEVVLYGIYIYPSWKASMGTTFIAFVRMVCIPLVVLKWTPFRPVLILENRNKSAGLRSDL